MQSAARSMLSLLGHAPDGIDDVAGERCARRGRREQNFAGKQGDDTVAERAVRFPLGDADHHPRADSWGRPSVSAPAGHPVAAVSIAFHFQ